MFFRKIGLILVFLVSFMGSDLCAKKVECRFDLRFVLEQTLKNNKTIKAAEKDVSSSLIGIDVQKSAFRPSIRIGVDHTLAENKHWSIDSSEKNRRQEEPENFRRDHDTKGHFIVSHNLFRGGADKAAVKEAESIAKAKKSEFESIKQNVLCESAFIFLDVIAKKKEMLHLESLLKARKSSLEVATEMYNTGVEKYVAVMQARAACAETESHLAKTEAEYKTLCAKFQETTGVEIQDNMVIPTNLFDDRMKRIQVQDIALRHNPKIIASFDRLNAAKDSVKKPNQGIYPSLDVFYRFDRSFDLGTITPTTTTNAKNHSVGVSFTIPIYDGGKGAAGKRQIIEQAAKTAIEHDKTIDETKSEIIRILAAIKAFKESTDDAEVAVEMRRLVLHDTEEEYKAGVKIMNDVLEAQQKLFEAQTIEVQTQNNYLKNQCNALALLGEMTIEHIQKRKFYHRREK